MEPTAPTAAGARNHGAAPPTGSGGAPLGGASAAAQAASGAGGSSAGAKLPDAASGATKKELKRDTAILREFDSSEDPNLLVLYHHIRDSSFDAFNGREYTAQMLRYCTSGFKVVLIAPRKIGGHNYALICLQHADAEKNVLCQLAYLCFRQFVGASMLVKKRCFGCHMPTEKKCTACQCAFFCSKECQKSCWSAHKPMCKMIDAAAIQVDADCLEVKL
eukprot:m.180586 g.180586  ORF g.180586 m.180586 type:complete len:219 (-) comp24564_c0_seq1:365-1021(-)